MPVVADRSLPLALSVGEPAGIGAEIAALAWRSRPAGRPFYCLADPGFLRSRLARAGIDIGLQVIAHPAQAAQAWETGMPVLPVGATMADRPGEPSPDDAPAVIAAIERAVGDVVAGRAAAVVTAPIQKANLYAAGFAFPGHTEFLGSLAARLIPGWAGEPVMMLAGPELSTVPVTVHIPLADVARTLTAGRIVTVGRIVAADLAGRLAIARPRIAVAGLNPHAGEDGTMGTEDRDVIAPAVATLRAAGIDARGPLPADTLFHPRARAGYDVVLAMYHDQALIPVKTIAFDETVNVTLGLPFVRTSPDHGTALDIAGQGIARPDSLLAALAMADRMSGGRGS